MTLPISLVPRPAAGAGQPPPPGPVLILTRPPGLALAALPGHGRQPGPPDDRSGLWLRNAAAGLGVLAAAAATVSFTAQYRMADAARHLPVIAALEAAIPDAAALVFACLGIALALHGRRALRARTLNLASVAASVFMNAIAAGPGWRNLAIWALPPVAYALASDTLIGVVRARAVARRHPPRHHPGRRRGHPAGHPRRPAPVAAPPGPGPRLHPGRVPRLGAPGAPGHPRPPRPEAPAGPRTAPEEGDQDRPLPRSSLVTGDSRICPDSAAARLRVVENSAGISCSPGRSGWPCRLGADQPAAARRRLSGAGRLRPARRAAGRAGSAAGRGRAQPARPGAVRPDRGELATRSETFRTWWPAHNVRLHRTGVKHLDLAPPRRSFPASGSPVLSQ